MPEIQEVRPRIPPALANALQVEIQRLTPDYGRLERRMETSGFDPKQGYTLHVPGNYALPHQIAGPAWIVMEPPGGAIYVLAPAR